jgi:hypothetical protein
VSCLIQRDWFSTTSIFRGGRVQSPMLWELDPSKGINRTNLIVRSIAEVERFLAMWSQGASACSIRLQSACFM